MFYLNSNERKTGDNCFNARKYYQAVNHYTAGLNNLISLAANNRSTVANEVQIDTAYALSDICSALAKHIGTLNPETYNQQDFETAKAQYQEHLQEAKAIVHTLPNGEHKKALNLRLETAQIFYHQLVYTYYWNRAVSYDEMVQGTAQDLVDNFKGNDSIDRLSNALEQLDNSFDNYKALRQFSITESMQDRKAYQMFFMNINKKLSDLHFAIAMAPKVTSIEPHIRRRIIQEAIKFNNQALDCAHSLQSKSNITLLQEDETKLIAAHDSYMDPNMGMYNPHRLFKQVATSVVTQDIDNDYQMK